MDIINWFQPKSIEHIRAYKYLREKGAWPEGFIPNGMKFGPYWQIELESLLATTYLEHIYSCTKG